MDPRLPTLSGFVLAVILVSWDFGQTFLDSLPLESEQWTLTSIYYYISV